jgi:hypothetical protein
MKRASQARRTTSKEPHPIQLSYLIISYRLSFRRVILCTSADRTMSSLRRDPSGPYPASSRYPTYLPPSPTSAPPGPSSPVFATPIPVAPSAAPVPPPPAALPDAVPLPSAIPAAAAAVNHAFDASAAAHELPPDLVARIAAQVRAEVVRSLREEMRVSPTAPAVDVPFYPPPPPGPPPSASSAAARNEDAALHAMQQQRQIQEQEQQRLQQLQQQRVQQAQQIQQQQQQQPQRHQSPQPPYPSIQRGSAGVLMPEAATFRAEGAGTGRRAVHTPPTPETHREGSEWTSSSATGGRGGGMTSPSPGTGRGPPAANVNSSSNSNNRDGEQRRTRAESRGGGGPTTTFERDLPDRSRPVPAPRVLTDKEETVVEKQWGVLFEREERGGAPTRRLGQFLRGLAHHLVEDFEPRGSLVIGPKKMRRFYELMKVDSEVFPWRGRWSLAFCSVQLT